MTSGSGFGRYAPGFRADTRPEAYTGPKKA
jgi:hypothetical protein